MNLIDKFNLNDPAYKFRLSKGELVISTFAINLLSMALPIMVLQVYDRIMVNQSIGTLNVLAIGVSIAVIFEVILRVARAYTTSWTGVMYEYTMAANAMRLHINADPIKLKKEGTGAQIQSLNAFSKLRDFYSGQSLITIVDIPFAVVFLILISYLTGLLVIVPLVLISLFTLITWFIGNKLKETLIAEGDIDDRRYNFIIEALQGIHTIKSLGLESLFTRRYERFEEDSSMRNYKTSIINTEGYTFGIFFNEVLIVSVVAFGAPMVIDGKFTSGALVATILLAGRLMQPIQKTLFLWNQFQEYRIANDQAEKMFAINAIKREELTKNEIPLIGAIKIKNLSFEYQGKKILNNISVDLNIPDIISITGKADSGKSALINLITGISEPSGGSILVDGVEVTKYSSEDIVKHIGCLSYEGLIFQGTILENLTAFDNKMESSAFEIAKMLNLDTEIGLMPKGYDTKITDGVADIIAPGVKQRIAIARVLIHKPKIILFNNADKSLDRDSYNLLLKLLNLLKGRVSMIIVSDDYNINSLANRKYLLDNGQLKEMQLTNDAIYDVKPYKELKI